MVLIAYLLWLAVTRKLDCGTSGDELFLLLLYAGPPAALLSLMIHATQPMPEIQGILRWLAVIPALLFFPVLLAAGEIFTSVYIDHEALCAGGSPPAWQFVLLPLVTVSVVAMLIICFRVWRSQPKTDADHVA